jgi:hypothetical protein
MGLQVFFGSHDKTSMYTHRSSVSCVPLFSVLREKAARDSLCIHHEKSLIDVMGDVKPSGAALPPASLIVIAIGLTLPLLAALGKSRDVFPGLVDLHHRQLSWQRWSAWLYGIRQLRSIVLSREVRWECKAPCTSLREDSLRSDQWTTHSSLCTPTPMTTTCTCLFWGVFFTVCFPSIQAS